MKKYRFLLFLPLMAGTLFSCTQAPKTSYTVSGDVSGLTDSIIYMRSRSADSIKTDSAVVKDGKFTFKGVAATPSMAAIMLDGRRGGVQFYLENADIKIKGTADSLNKATVTGSKSQDEFVELQNSIKGLTTQQDSLYNKYRMARMANDTATANPLEKQMEDLDKQIAEQTKKFIIAHPKSYVSLNSIQPLFYSTEYAELNKIFTGLDTSLQNTDMGKKMAEQLTAMKNTAIGQPAIQFTQNDVNDKPVNLADFKGKYVLVDFWASWCGPCRAENPNVVKAYNQYKDKNFTILGVSLDSKKDNWLKAIKDDKLAWTQVSDLKGWKNEVAAQYGVRAIPANFLIDPSGKIIGHNLRGEELEKKLAEVLK